MEDRQSCLSGQAGLPVPHFPCQRTCKKPQRRSDKKWIERGLQNGDLIERNHTGEHREHSGNDCRAIAEPNPRRIEGQNDCHGAQDDLRYACSEEIDAEDSQEVEIQRRNEKRLIGSMLCQGNIHAGVHVAARLQQRMIVERVEHARFHRERGQKNEKRPAPWMAPGGIGLLVLQRLEIKPHRRNISPRIRIRSRRAERRVRL